MHVEAGGAVSYVRLQRQSSPPRRADIPLTVEVKETKRIRFKGARWKGTLTPRRLWAPGEVVTVDDCVAEELVRDQEFQLVRSRKSKKVEGS